jgi:hypothetical protein
MESAKQEIFGNLQEFPYQAQLTQGPFVTALISRKETSTSQRRGSNHTGNCVGIDPMTALENHHPESFLR